MSESVHDKANETRTAIREAMERYSDAYESTEGGKVLNFVCLAEVVSPDGERGILELNGGATDDRPITTWGRDGLLFNGLHDPWFRNRDRHDD